MPDTPKTSQRLGQAHPNKESGVSTRGPHRSRKYHVFPHPTIPGIADPQMYAYVANTQPLLAPTYLARVTGGFHPWRARKRSKGWDWSTTSPASSRPTKPACSLAATSRSSAHRSSGPKRRSCARCAPHPPASSWPLTWARLMGPPDPFRYHQQVLSGDSRTHFTATLAPRRQAGRYSPESL